jgi:hypothetical protein
VNALNEDGSVECFFSLFDLLVLYFCWEPNWLNVNSKGCVEIVQLMYKW